MINYVIWLFLMIMCGFFGVLSYSGNVNSSTNFLNYALQDLSKRGPDQEGVWRNADVLIGFRRLAIRDLSQAGDQPMISSNGNFVLVYNGEIYNTSSLMDWAGINNSQLKGHSDTEILLSCVEKKGVRSTLERLDGIFAIAIYDVHQKSITLAKDHAGVKPLYYGVCDKGVVFASHYHLVTAHPYFAEEEVRPDALFNYLKYGFIQEGEGLLKNTFNLPHGHFLCLSGGGKNWWEPYVDPDDLLQPHNTEPGHALASTFEDVVRSQMISDVPVGTFLSGGVDSTITSALAARANKHLTAFTIGVDDPVLDESSEAIRFAQSLKLNHVIHELNEDTLLTVIDEYDDCMGEPLADYSSLMTLKVAELAKKQITVALSGDGGDELFWGYPRFLRAAKYVSYYNASATGKWFRVIAGKVTRKHIPPDVRVHANFRDYYLSKQSIPGAERWTRLLLSKYSGRPVPYFAGALTGDVSTTKQAMRFARALEFHIHLQRVLLKVDRASMYHSLEVRTPILSRSMINISATYEYADCVNSAKAKIPLRRLLTSLLPPGEPDSGSKKGFEPPLGKWLRGTLKKRFEDRLFSIPSLYHQHISKEAITKMWEEHQSGINNTWMIWSLYSLFTWTEKKMYRTCM